ncbi:hypothetical protein Tco_1158665, partial [Tanacetum coccineum]
GLDGALIIGFCSGYGGSVVESAREIPKEHLVFLLGREIVEDIRKALGDCGDSNESLGLLEHLQMECMEKGVPLRLMMKETQLKISEKSSFILKLRGGYGGLGFCRCWLVVFGVSVSI